MVNRQSLYPQPVLSFSNSQPDLLQRVVELLGDKINGPDSRGGYRWEAGSRKLLEEFSRQSEFHCRKGQVRFPLLPEFWQLRSAGAYRPTSSRHPEWLDFWHRWHYGQPKPWPPLGRQLPQGSGRFPRRGWTFLVALHPKPRPRPKVVFQKNHRSLSSRHRRLPYRSRGGEPAGAITPGGRAFSQTVSPNSR